MSGTGCSKSRTVLADQEGGPPTWGSFVRPLASLFCHSSTFSLVEKGHGPCTSPGRSLSKAPGWALESKDLLTLFHFRAPMPTLKKERLLIQHRWHGQDMYLLSAGGVLHRGRPRCWYCCYPHEAQKVDLTCPKPPSRTETQIQVWSPVVARVVASEPYRSLCSMFPQGGGCMEGFRRLERERDVAFQMVRPSSCASWKGYWLQFTYLRRLWRQSRFSRKTWRTFHF